MKTAIDSSIIVSALHSGDPNHDGCCKVLLSGRPSIFSHALSETFSTLTGGRLEFRVSSAEAAGLLQRYVAPRLHSILLDGNDLLTAFSEAQGRGVRGGAIYDYLHLFAARKAGIKRLYTLNLGDFLSFQRNGDPEVVRP